MKTLDLTIVGGGMITNDLLLPAVYHLQRIDVVREINICALNSQPLKELKDNPELMSAFPGQKFNAFPSADEDKEKMFPELYKDVLKNMKPRQVVIVAVPDQFHYDIVMDALNANQHVLCVKPLVLEYKQAVKIETLAYRKGLFVGVEYHKRFDRRSLLAKKHYQNGKFGEFKLGEACLIEPYFYRNSNFKNWFTVDKTDPFVYIGCHYVDLVYFITGLKPTEVSVRGVTGSFPNGNKGYMWSQGSVRFENEAILNVNNGLGYPHEGAGSNDQGLIMFCESNLSTGMIKHNDQFRGVTHSYLKNRDIFKKTFSYLNPDFLQLAPWNGEGLEPIGYGYDSVAATIKQTYKIENEVVGLNATDSLSKRQQIIKEIDDRGLIATPANSSINELVVEAARKSIKNDGDRIKIYYGDNAHVK